MRHARQVRHALALAGAEREPTHDDRQAFLRKEAARMLGVSEGLIIKLGRLGKIKTIPIGRRRLVPRCEIDRILREGIS